MLDNTALMIGMTLLYATPLMFGAFGGVISERSGVINIGIEGMMAVGAFTAAATGYYLQNAFLGFLFGALAGGFLALLHAVACITFKADQTISGMAINLIGSGAALFVCRIFFDGSVTTKPNDHLLPKIFGGEVQGFLSRLNTNVSFLIAIVVGIILWFVLYKTKYGLRIRAVGEHPAAADTLGINVSKVRYSCVFTSGLLSGMGGAAITLGIVSQFNSTSVAGQGFIALAAVVFGKWTPHGAFGACLIFGFAQALVVMLGGDFQQVPSEILSMLPYILTILILVFFVRNSYAPKASGKAYEKGSR